MAVLAILIFLGSVVISVPLMLMLFDAPTKEYRELVALDEQRSVMAYQISYKAAHADWLTRRKFKRYLKRGGGNFL